MRRTRNTFNPNDQRETSIIQNCKQTAIRWRWWWCFPLCMPSISVVWTKQIHKPKQALTRVYTCLMRPIWLFVHNLTEIIKKLLSKRRRSFSHISAFWQTVNDNNQIRIRCNFEHLVDSNEFGQRFSTVKSHCFWKKNFRNYCKFFNLDLQMQIPIEQNVRIVNFSWIFIRHEETIGEEVFFNKKQKILCEKVGFSLESTFLLRKFMENSHSSHFVQVISAFQFKNILHRCKNWADSVWFCSFFFLSTLRISDGRIRVAILFGIIIFYSFHFPWSRLVEGNEMP